MVLTAKTQKYRKSKPTHLTTNIPRVFLELTFRSRGEETLQTASLKLFNYLESIPHPFWNQQQVEPWPTWAKQSPPSPATCWRIKNSRLMEASREPGQAEWTWDKKRFDGIQIFPVRCCSWFPSWLSCTSCLNRMWRTGPVQGLWERWVPAERRRGLIVWDGYLCVCAGFHKV